MAKGVKTGGRQKGARNKRTRARLALADQAASEGITPLEAMLDTMRLLHAVARGKKVAPTKLKFAIAAASVARDAAPYIHPRLASARVEHDIGPTLAEMIARIEPKKE